MKAPSNGYRIVRTTGGGWVIYDERRSGPPVWTGKTFIGARTAHYRLSVARATGKPVSYKQARRAGNG